MKNIKDFLLPAALTMGLLTAVSCGNDNDDDDPVSGVPQEEQEAGARAFTVTIQNVSQPGLLNSDVAQGAVPLSPGAWAVFEGMENPAFTPGERADVGTERIAEDGQVEPPMGFETTLLGAAKSSGTFSAPGGPAPSPAIMPGESATFTFTAAPGDRLTFETMFVPSNDWFYGDNGKGIALFDEGNNPTSGDVTGLVYLWDAGTEVSEKPGMGEYQAPRQPQGATDVGPEEKRSIQLVQNRFRGWRVPENSQVLKVTITPQ